MPSLTGVIGHLYDFAKFEIGAAYAARSLREDGLGDFARAIMTTDTRPKIASTAFKSDARPSRSQALSKESG